MLLIEHTEITGFAAALRGMRNPLNSWGKADSKQAADGFCMGANDQALALRLAEDGAVHAKYRRMLTVTCDITAPLYWWKEFDTYKVGTVANSCSTMHKIHAKEFTLDDFSHEHLDKCATDTLMRVVWNLNMERKLFLQSKNKANWWNMIQLLPSSYNQKRTVLMNYEVLAGMYQSRKAHKLDEWRTFCKWIEQLDYSELITGNKR